MLPFFAKQGLGDNGPKSSTVPTEVKTLDKVYIRNVTLGFSHTLMIARCDSEEDKTNIEKCPLYSPS